MVNGKGNARERWKTTIALISRKANFARVANFFCTFLCRCFARLKCETSRNFLVLCFLKERSYVFLFTFFSLLLIFNLHWWLLAFLLSLPQLQNFHVVIPTKKCLLFLISRSRSLLLFFSLSFAGLPLTLSFFGAVFLLLFISNLWTWQLI